MNTAVANELPPSARVRVLRCAGKIISARGNREVRATPHYLVVHMDFVLVQKHFATYQILARVFVALRLFRLRVIRVGLIHVRPKLETASIDKTETGKKTLQGEGSTSATVAGVGE